MGLSDRAYRDERIYCLRRAVPSKTIRWVSRINPLLRAAAHDNSSSSENLEHLRNRCDSRIGLPSSANVLVDARAG